MQKIIKTGVNFILNSDAHDKNKIGKCTKGFHFVLQYDIPKLQLANVNQTPIFKNKNTN
jgi:histidinol phosphatase-like PHP family hydrolase